MVKNRSFVFTVLLILGISVVGFLLINKSGYFINKEYRDKGWNQYVDAKFNFEFYYPENLYFETTEDYSSFRRTVFLQKGELLDWGSQEVPLNTVFSISVGESNKTIEQKYQELAADRNEYNPSVTVSKTKINGLPSVTTSDGLVIVQFSEGLDLYISGQSSVDIAKTVRFPSRTLKDWNTYTDDESGFSVSYPSSWNLEREEREGVSDYVYLTLNLDTGASTGPIPEPVDYRIAFDIQDDIDYEGIDEGLVVLESVTVNGYRAYKTTTVPSQLGQLMYLIENKDGTYISIDLSPYADTSRKDQRTGENLSPFENQDKVENDFKQILYSFELL